MLPSPSPCTSLIAGYILNTGIPGGYQVIFIIGAFGAAMSSYHIYHVKPLRDENPASPPPIPVAASQSVSPRSLTAALRLDVWNSKRFTFCWQCSFFTSHYLSSPLYPIFNVRVLNLNDSHLGNGTALYYLSVLLASTQLGRIVNRFGNKRITGWGVAGMASYPLMLAFAQNVWQFYALSFLGGFLFCIGQRRTPTICSRKHPPMTVPSSSLVPSCLILPSSPVR
ncbi:MAG: MFS transporter [Anaerolineales bacterium]|nr:MFS transporter [Anaerolineales bacterium]